MRFLTFHQILERKSILLLIGILITVAIGGLVEIVPLFYLKSTVEKVEGMRPYTPSGARRSKRLHPRRLLRLPLSDDPDSAR